MILNAGVLITHSQLCGLCASLVLSILSFCFAKQSFCILTLAILKLRLSDNSWFPIQRVGLFCGVGIFLVHLDGLVRLAGYQTAARLVEDGSEDTGLAVQRTRLCYCLHLLEIVPSFVIPKLQRACCRRRHRRRQHCQ